MYRLTCFAGLPSKQTKSPDWVVNTISDLNVGCRVLQNTKNYIRISDLNIGYRVLQNTKNYIRITCPDLEIGGLS